MAKGFYLPRTDHERNLWLNNFANKFAIAAAGLGFATADVTSVNNDASMFQYLVNQVEACNTTKEQQVNFKNLMKDGPLGKMCGPLPVAHVPPPPPTMVAPGIFPRVRKLVQRIKNSPAYTEAIGRDLGIIGAEQTTVHDTMKPILKLVIRGGQVEVQWTKGDAQALHLESDKGNGWQFLAIDIMPHYRDTTTITALGVWKYRAIYLVDDQRVGQWSDEASITVGLL